MLSDEEMILSFLDMKTVLMTPEAFPFGSISVRKRFRSEAIPFGVVPFLRSVSSKKVKLTKGTRSGQK